MTTIDARSINPDVEAIRHHYEVGNDLYRLILGPTMMYSGGYWEDGEDLVATLDEAQERKLDVFTDLAHAAHTAKVLDIGCGWGTMLNRLTTVHGVTRAVGVTLSRTQADFITALNNPAIEARVESWEDHQHDGQPYDAAFCINALEHFVLSSLTPKERTQRYRVFFKQVHSLLKPGARFVLHTMTVENPPLRRQLLDDLKFLQREEFEGCHIPRLPELATGLDGLFEVTEIRNEPESFARACRAWLHHLATHRTEALTHADETTIARFERYLDIFAYTLEDHIFNNFRVTLTRRP